MQGLLILGLLWTSAFAPQAVQQGSWGETHFHRVYLRNGNVIEGQLAMETPAQVVLRLPVGEMAIRRDQIERVEFVRMRSKTEPEAVKQAALYERAERTPPTSPLPTSKAEPPPSNARLLGPPPPIPAALKKKLDALLLRWKPSGRVKDAPSDEDLAIDLQDFGPEAVPYLAWLTGQSPALLPPRALALALGRSGGPQAMAALVELLKEKDADLRRAAAEGLAQAGDVAEPYLLTALDDETPEVWQTASRSLADRIQKGSGPCLKAVVAGMLRSRVKAPYVLALGQAGTREAHRELLHLLEENDENSRIAALQGLELLRDPEDVEVLLRYVSVGSPSVRKQICLILGKVKARAAVNELIPLLGQEDLGLRSNAYWALKEITGQPLAPDPDLWKTWWETTGSKERK